MGQCRMTGRQVRNLCSEKDSDLERCCRDVERFRPRYKSKSKDNFTVEESLQKRLRRQISPKGRRQ